jgi:hypothetical protein
MLMRVIVKVEPYPRKFHSSPHIDTLLWRNARKPEYRSRRQASIASQRLDKHCSHSNVDRRFLHNGGVAFVTTDKFNPSIKCPLFSSRRTVLRRWLTELTDRCRHRELGQFGSPEFSLEPRRQKWKFVCQERQCGIPNSEDITVVLNGKHAPLFF